MTISEERKRRVIDLYYNQGKTTREIAKTERMSIRDISTILKEEEARLQKYKDQHQQEEKSSKAYELFSKGKTPVEVAATLNLREPEVTKFYREYWKLRGLQILDSIYIKTNGKIWLLWKLYQELIEKRGMSIAQVANAVDTDINRLPYMETLYIQAKDEAEKMQHTIQRLANHIMALEHKISLLDKIAFSGEQECKRTKQQVQQLTAQKNRLEKLIANILNGEGYSKLKQIVKENVKAVLSEKRVLISISFASVIQTLKDNPQTVNLIQNIAGVNDGEQHKDNHINITQYFESNKDRILYLTEKNYENLVEVLTNDSISNAAASSSNPTSSLPHASLSNFPYLSTQSDTYRIEEAERFHNSKGDIAE